MDFKITFWGVRGSKPTPGKNTVLFGGNTSCVQIEASDQNLIFDAGTGIVELGQEMVQKGKREADIFFSHLHWDHIQGLPFFLPLFIEDGNFRLYGENKGDKSFEEIIKGQMCSPYYPITMDIMKSNYRFITIKPEQRIEFKNGLSVKSFALDHPNGSLAFRLEKGSSVLVFATDTETLTGKQRGDFVDFIKNADLFIYDTSFTEAEYFGLSDQKSKEKWGHSTWEEGVKLSKEAAISCFVLYHHKPERSDQELEQLEALAQTKFSNSVAAREGMVIKIGGGFPEKMVVNYPA